MVNDVIATHLENIDRRFTTVEQFLPTVATKEDLQAAIAATVAPLATREELHATVAAAVAPLATREELRTGLHELRRYMDVLSESQRDDIRLIAEHLSVVMSRLNSR